MVEMHVHIRLLGGFGVTMDGQEVPPQRWRRRSAAGLVKLLALQPGARLHREQVMDALWPDLLLDDAAPRLHTAAHYARTAAGIPAAIVLSGGNVLLFPSARLSTDVAEFDRAADRARAEGSAEAADDAAGRYAGALLPDDLYEPWTEEPRERLRLRHLDLLRTAGRYDDLVAADPLDEEAHLALVEDQLRQGRRQTALRSLDRMAEVFRRELGVEPGPVAVALRTKAESLPAEPAVPVQRSPRSTSGRARSPLPAPRYRLIGRRADLDMAAALLRSHRVVTIAGPGGAGKSTLALALARRLQTDGDAGAETEVVLAELASVREESDVTRAVAEAAGVEGEGAVETAALASNLGQRTLLLILDNCEHLLDASAALVDAVLDAGARSRILVTSREPLRVDGEAVHRLGSLGQDSPELFVERAEAAAGAGIVTEDDQRVVDLCARLDGLPLAIELAAAQLQHLSLQELSDRLDDRLNLLVGGRPKAGGRHSTLTATIEWSYRLLSEEARTLFDRLGVFPASFDLPAVRAVAEGQELGEVTNLLGELVAKSLVVHDPVRRRYRLLESIRLFAARRLEDSGSSAQAAELLRRHVVARARELPRVRTWLSTAAAARSRDDIENVRTAFEASIERRDLTAAVDVALAISTLWRNAVSYAEGRAWVTDLLAHDLSPEDRLWTLILEADVGLGSGDPRMVRAAAEEAARLTGEIDDPGAEVITAIYGALVHLIAPDLAVRALEAACAQARDLGEPGLERLARGFRLVALRMLGRADEAETEAVALTDASTGLDYDRYICLWAASLVALVDRDGPRLRRLLDAQYADLWASRLYENWLTMYWQALSEISGGQDYLPQLRRARRRAEAEGRDAEADCVLALAYAAACHDDWEQAAELVGAIGGALHRDTASFIHESLVREQLVEPRLDPEQFAAAYERGRELDIRGLLEERMGW